MVMVMRGKQAEQMKSKVFNLRRKKKSENTIKIEKYYSWQRYTQINQAFIGGELFNFLTKQECAIASRYSLINGISIDSNMPHA